MMSSIYTALKVTIVKVRLPGRKFGIFPRYMMLTYVSQPEQVARKYS